MGRTAGNFCSRESMYHHSTNLMSSDSTPRIEIAKQTASDAMTWQQQTEFGSAMKVNDRKRKQKAARWKPLDLEATVAPPTDPTTGEGSVQQADLPTVSPRSRPHVKAATSPLCTSNTPSSMGPLHQDPIASNDPTARRKNTHRRRHNKPKSDATGKMSRPTTSVPPHVRRKAAAAAAALVAQPKVESSATNGSSIASKGTKPGQGIKLRSSPNDANQVMTPPPSLPATPRQSEGEKTASAKAGVKAPQVTVITPVKTIQTGIGGCEAAWDPPKPEAPPKAPKQDKSRWPRINGGPKKTIWPKQSEMRALPSDSSSEGGVSCHSNSDGDPNYDVRKLMDWNGDWLPPPEQWSARKDHTSRHFGAGIEQWINGHGTECAKLIEYDATSFHENGTCKELVPRYWLHTMIEQKPLGNFWKDMPNQPPHALSDIDPLAVSPFWEQYEDAPSCFIEGLVVPEARVDALDVNNHDPKGDLLASANERVRAVEAARAYKLRRTLLRQKRPPKDFNPSLPSMKDKRIQPRSNVYFRPVKPTDVEGITAIYNHYVNQTIFANEFDERTVEHIASRISGIVANGLPYLVAVARGNQPRGPQGYISEKIVGFINLDDYCDRSSMYRFTFELELYVHPGYQSQNIASCLLDRLLEMANTGYNACGGYEYNNDSQYLKTGPSRVIKTIILTVLKEDGEDNKKTSEFLTRFGFRCVGHIKGIGFKLGKVIDQYLYRHVTTEPIDANSRPTVPLERD